MHRVFQKEPRRFEMYYDLAHWNKRGMTVTARTFFDEIDQLGWWSEGPGGKDDRATA